MTRESRFFSFTGYSSLKATRLSPKALAVLTREAQEGSASVKRAAAEALIKVGNNESLKLVGVVNEVEVMLAYNRALLRARAEERGEL